MTVCLSTNGPSVCHSEGPPMRLLVATLNGVDIIERASLGEPWRHVGHTLDGKHPSALMKPPGNAGVFASVHNGGIFHSVDDGRNWTPSDKGVTSGHVFSLGFNQHANGVTLYAGTEPVSLFRSDDNGANWTELPSIGKAPGHENWTFPPPPHLAHTKGYLFDARDPKVFYVCVEQGALLKTSDGGHTWRELSSFYRPSDKWPKDIHRLVSDPRDPDRLFMATGMGLFRSNDAGETWTELTNMEARVGYPDQIMFSPGDPSILFASGAERDPATWRQSHQAHGTVVRSRDGGVTWQTVDKGLPSGGRANIEAMNAATWQGGFMLFAGTTDGEIYASEDGAESWTRIVSGLRPVSKGGHFRNLQQVAAE